MSVAHLTLGRLLGVDGEMDLGHGLFDHGDGVRTLGVGVDATFGDLGGDLAPEVLNLVGALLVADLHLALFENLEDDVRRLGRPKRLLQVVSLGGLPL
jgi:hypothetical protein